MKNKFVDYQQEGRKKGRGKEIEKKRKKRKYFGDEDNTTDNRDR